MTAIDQQRLITLRLSRGLAVRQLARDCGIEIGVLNRLETSDDPTLSTLSVAALVRLADRLQVPIGHLFTDDLDNTPAPDPSPDHARLGALLNALGQATPVTALADALDWSPTRVHQAADDLTRLLAPAGMTVFRNSGLMSIRPEDDLHTDAELKVRRHPRTKGTQRLVTPARTKILYRAARTPISPHSLSNPDRVNIATLLKAGVLVEDANRHYVPSADVLESLNPVNIKHDQ
ncbi:XRE family transcriptional regulator [Nocardioides seonyuensis]|uniref:XRE family transcriptional regulator n=1 Tax=Nocardioides seonyuensis TaxID=2518371 RepID=A0A4V1BME3_9ACTN|nr:helix-turn-helix domain-containing protein [Nocardioides seonyuensis]QBX56072.1 XRE family transcriptional regulator [Nocardioides seonyuensis]